jgi:integrase/recombinase XerD
MENDFKALAGKFEQTLKLRNLDAMTIKEKLRKVHCFLAYLARQETTSVAMITRAIVQGYQTELYQTINQKGLPNGVSYQNEMLSAVKVFMRFLKEYDYIVSDPSADILYAKAPQRLPGGILTASEARRIINAPDTKSVIGYRDRTLLEVLYSTGMRKAEVCNLKLGDVDYHDGFLLINQGKGKKDRVVPIGKIACRYLENYIKSVRPELIKDPYDNHLFLSIRGGKLSHTALWELVKKYARQAKIKKNIHCHTFRHSCATHMLRNKADIRAIQELLGHASLNSTQVYTHVSITDLKEVHSRCHPREKDRE